MKGVKNAQNGGGLGWLGVTQGHQQCHYSIERIRFPIRHQSKLCVYLIPFSRHGELFVEIRQLRSTPSAFGAPIGDDPGRISKRFLAPENCSPWAIVWHCLRVPMFSHFSRTPTCDGHRRTDRQTDRHTPMAYTARAYMLAR